MGVGGDGALSTHSNHAPAKPLDMQAAKMATRPTLGSCPPSSSELGENAEEGDDDDDDDGITDSSCTVATPAVRSNKENHFLKESAFLKNMSENRAVVRSFSCQEQDVSQSQVIGPCPCT